jgi:hypothetical protein
MLPFESIVSWNFVGTIFKGEHKMQARYYEDQKEWNKKTESERDVAVVSEKRWDDGILDVLVAGDEEEHIGQPIVLHRESKGFSMGNILVARALTDIVP